MSKFAKKYNKGRFEAKAHENATYLSLKQLGSSDTIYTIRAMYINTKGKYGDSPVVLIDDCRNLVNLPSHLTDTVRNMLEDGELIQAINNKQFGFSVYAYEGTNGSGLSVNWEDINVAFDSDLPF